MARPEQLQELWNLSDTLLYPDAVALIRRLVNEEDCLPLPASQVAGLLNIANASSYADLTRFMKHQRDRDWPASKKDILIFYTELEKYLITIRNKRLPEMIPLARAGQSAREANRELDELMILLARDFIQHLVMENALLAAERASARTKRR